MSFFALILDPIDFVNLNISPEIMFSHFVNLFLLLDAILTVKGDSPFFSNMAISTLEEIDSVLIAILGPVIFRFVVEIVVTVSHQDIFILTLKLTFNFFIIAKPLSNV